MPGETQCRFFAPFTLLTSLAVACSSHPTEGASAPGTTAPESDAGKPAVGSASLTLEAPRQGFQLRTDGTDIASGEDTEYCEIVLVPGSADEIYYVNRIQIEMVKHSHHLIISSADESLPAYQGLEVGSIQHCFGAQELVGIAGATMVTGSQLPYFERTYPDGVGLEFHGGQKLVFDYHYYNTEDHRIHTGHRVNFDTVDAVDHIGKTFGFYNFTIDTPPAQTARFTGECQFSSDVLVGQLTRHTHQWGRDFSVWYAGGPDDGKKIWTSQAYEGDTEFAFETPVLMSQGSGFRFECDFENDTGSDLRFGPKATDEMCILFGIWWEPGAAPVARQGCAMTGIDPDGIARGLGAAPAATN